MLLFSWWVIPSSKTGGAWSVRRGVLAAGGRGLARRGLAWRCEGGGESGEQDVEAAFEFGGAVVGGQDGGQAAEEGEVADREAVQAEAEQVGGLVGADGEFLEFVGDGAVQEAEQGAVDVEGVGAAEPG